MKELASALSAAQAEFPPIERLKTVTVQTKTGGSYKFNYAPLDLILEKVRPALTKHGLSISQQLTHLEERMAIRTLILHSSGDVLEDVFPIPAAPLIGAQELGSVITYIRRYAIVAALGIATEEDDDATLAKRGRKSAGVPRGRTGTPAVVDDETPEGAASTTPAESASPQTGAGEPPPAGSSPFQPPAGPRGGKNAQLEADELAAELRELVTALEATDSLPKIEEKRAAADIGWLKRQKATAEKALERRAAS